MTVIILISLSIWEKNLKSLTSGHKWGRYGAMLVESSIPEKRIALMARHFKQRNEELAERGTRPEIPQMCTDTWINISEFLPAKDKLSVASLSKDLVERMWKNQHYLEIVLKHAGIKTAEINSIPALFAEYDPCFTPPPWLAKVLDPVTETHFQKALTKGRQGNDYGKAMIGRNIPKEKIKDCITIICQILRLPGNNITALFLTHSNIGDEEAKILADTLKHPNCKVAILNLGANNITFRGCQDYLSSIIDRVIAILNLNHNKIDLLDRLNVLDRPDLSYVWTLPMEATGQIRLPKGLGDFERFFPKIDHKLQYVSVLSQGYYDRGIWLMNRDSSAILSKTLSDDDMKPYYAFSRPINDVPYYFMCDMRTEAVLEFVGRWEGGRSEAWNLLVFGNESVWGSNTLLNWARSDGYWH